VVAVVSRLAVPVPASQSERAVEAPVWRQARMRLAREAAAMGPAAEFAQPLVRAAEVA
jgi:hypothetical protein